MKTKLVRPILVETKNKSRICHLSQKGKEFNDLRFLGVEAPIILDSINYQLILISLDPDEKIEVGDTCYLDYVHRHEPDKNPIKIFTGQITNSLYHFTDGSSYFPVTIKKVIATQDQLSPDLINQLVAEYNNGGMQDFEIEMEEYDHDEEWSDIGGAYETFKVRLKLTNGFVTVVDTVIEKPLDDYIKKKHSQDRCMGFIDGYNTRKSEEPISYTEEEVYKLFKKSCERLTNRFISSDIEWFNENKKK